MKKRMLITEPFQEDGSLKADLIIRSSDLTELGNQLFKEVVPKWFAYIDRGGDVHKVTTRVKGLHKLQEQGM